MNIWKRQNRAAIACVSLLLHLICALPDSLQAESCDCWPVSSTAEAVKGATLVFTGEVLQLKRFSLEPLGKDYKEFAVKMRVVRMWKGDIKNFIIIRTPAETKHCGIKFEPGQNWLIYAIGGPIPQVIKCSRTSLVNSITAQNDVKILGTGTVP